MYKLIDYPHITESTLSALICTAEYDEELNKETKAYWSKTDSNKNIVAEGGICLDEDCDCQGSWTDWEN